MCFLIGPLPECQSANKQGLGLRASSLPWPGLASPPLYLGRFSPVFLQPIFPWAGPVFCGWEGHLATFHLGCVWPTKDT